MRHAKHLYIRTLQFMFSIPATLHTPTLSTLQLRHRDRADTQPAANRLH